MYVYFKSDAHTKGGIEQLYNMDGNSCTYIL